LDYLPRITEKLVLPLQEGKAQLKAAIMEMKQEIRKMEDVVNSINSFSSTVINMDGQIANR
jgi:hypothetical protein